MSRLWSVFLFASLACGGSAAAQGKDFPAGQEFFFQSQPGASKEDLGRGYDLTLSSTGIGRAFPLRVSSRKANRFEFKYTHVQDDFSLKANAKYLGLSGSLDAAKKRRFQFIHAYHVMRVDKLEVDTWTPQGKGHLVPIEVWYGWSVDILVSGSKTDFTAKARANLVKVGADLDAVISKNNLTRRVTLRGLKQKGGKIGRLVLSSPEAIVNQFEVAPEPVPIYVRYKSTKPIHATPIAWSAKKPILRGVYRVEVVSLRLKAKKANGKGWDIGWGKKALPDPIVQLITWVDADGDRKPDGPAQVQASSFDKDTLTPKCAGIAAQTIFLDKPLYIEFAVADKDLSKPDPIGTSGIALPMAELAQRVGEQISVPCNGQIEQLVIRVVVAR
jgi:hypothetical protein